MSILVIGGTGTVGSHVVRGLLAKGEAVRILTRSADHADLLPLEASSIIGDLRKPETLRCAMKGIDRVCLVTPLSPTEREEGLAAVKETQAAASLGVLDGVTTNPSLVAKEGRIFREALVEICNMVDGPISAEVVCLEAEAMVKEGKELAKIHQNIVVKVPLIPEGLKATTRMAAEGIKVNVTLCFSPTQALLAAKSGAWCVSPFFGRLDDISSNGMELIRQIVTIHKSYNFKTYVLVASVRHPQHVVEAALAGGHICTMPFSIFQQLVKHPLTDLGMNTFLADWNAQLQKAPTTREGIPP